MLSAHTLCHPVRWHALSSGHRVDDSTVSCRASHQRLWRSLATGVRNELDSAPKNSNRGLDETGRTPYRCRPLSVRALSRAPSLLGPSTGRTLTTSTPLTYATTSVSLAPATASVCLAGRVKLAPASWDGASLRDLSTCTPWLPAPHRGTGDSVPYPPCDACASGVATFLCT